MRTLEWGKFSSQFADFTHRQLSGASIIIDGDPSNTDTTAPDATHLMVGNNHPNNVKELIKVSLANVRAQISNKAKILRATLSMSQFDQYGNWPAGGATLSFYRILKAPDYADATYRNRDATGPVRWTNDGYSPLHGADVALSPCSTLLVPKRTGDIATYTDTFDITTELQEMIRTGEDLQLLFRWEPLGGVLTDYAWTKWNWDTEGQRPYLAITYLLAVEMFKAKADGTIDLSKMLNNTSGALEDMLFLGDVERGQTGEATKSFLKNFDSQAPSHIETWDDYPEWSDPVQKAGTGVGKLDYVTLAEAAVSQKYTIKFSSPTAYEVKAEAHADNPTGLHTTYDGAPAWQGATSGNWTAPSGGLTLPIVAWQPGMLANDEIEVFVLGNTTDTSWAADANDQVEETLDSSGSPDAAKWRPICGQRSKSRASVTIDATSKKIPTRALVTALWTVGGKAFVADATHIHHGTVGSVSAAALGTATFTGTGLNDFARSGNYNGAADRSYRAEIDGTGSPNTFKWSRDGGATWVATGVAITGAAQLFEDGVYGAFGATTGHTVGDRWDFTATCWGVTLSGLTNDSTVYAANSFVGTTLPVRTLGAGVWSKTNAACGKSTSPANRIWLLSTSGMTAGQGILIRDVVTPSLYEELVIDAVTSTYINTTAIMLNDYASGALVMVKAAGEAAIWARPVATAITADGLKRFRLNLRR